MTTIHVGGASPYDVEIGRDLADRLPDMLGDKVERVAFLYAGTLGALAEPVLDRLVERFEVLALGLPDGEAAKTAAVANDCWEALGEKAFTRSDAVVTFGGGAVLDPETQAALAEHSVVFLRVGVGDAVKRVGLGAGRPLLLGNVRGRIKALLDERTPVYEAVATLVVDTDGRTPADIATEIEERLA